MTETGPKLSLFERTRIQMQAVVPLVRGLQRVLGEKTVNDAIATWREQETERARRERPDDRPIDARRVLPAFHAWAVDALEFEVLGADADRCDVDVTSCRYAELMQSLDARDIGELLICSGDHRLAALDGLELVRSQTRMGGASHCDFRFRKPGGAR